MGYAGFAGAEIWSAVTKCASSPANDGVAHLAEEVELGVEGARGLEVARLHRLAQLGHLLRRNVRLQASHPIDYLL